MLRTALLSIAVLSFGLAADPPRGLHVEAAPAVSCEARTALVIGNGGYKDAPLRNPVNDARAMAGALRKCGFAVTELENATRGQMREGLRSFGARIAEGGVGLFYFAGHGMQVKGRNYLIPVGADIALEDEVAGEAVDLDSILAKMETARNRLNIVVLDACRNNPFGRSFRSSQQGLAQVDAPTGSFVAFATAPGRTAADGGGAHGTYTEALLHQLQTPGQKLEEVFKRTRVEVLKATGQQQTPWENSSIVGDFYFVPGAAGSPSAPTRESEAAAMELSYWNSIKDSRVKEDFEGYLEKYPLGTFADIARRRVQSLNTKTGGASAGVGQPPSIDQVKGNLQVVVTGADARILLDGNPQGVARPETPLNLTGLLAGEFKLRAEAPDCLPIEQRVRVEAGKWRQMALAMKKGERLVVYRVPTHTFLVPSDWIYEVLVDGEKLAGLANKDYVLLNVSREPHTLKVLAGVHPDYNVEASLRVDAAPQAPVRYFRVKTTCGWMDVKLAVTEVDEGTFKRETADSRSVVALK